MVVERIISVKEARSNLLWVFASAQIISLVALLTSFIVFKKFTGIFTTMLITIISFPFMYELSKTEEALDELRWNKKISIFRRHRRITEIYLSFFLGIVLTYSIVFVMLPRDISAKIFQEQIKEIEAIRGAFLPTFFSSTHFWKILSNNLTVLILSFLLAILISAGAVFVLAWNATLLSVAIGIESKNLFGIFYATSAYFPHGFPEFLAYFLAVISGSVLSAALTKKGVKHLSFIVKDCFQILALAAILIFLAAMVETYLLTQPALGAVIGAFIDTVILYLFLFY